MIKSHYLQVWSTLIRVQISHLTTQHHWNIQLQRSRTVYIFETYPLPQHKRSHPSIPIDVALHSRPYVPGKSVEASFSQYDEEDSKYTRSRLPGFLWLGLTGANWKDLYLFFFLPLFGLFPGIQTIILCLILASLVCKHCFHPANKIRILNTRIKILYAEIWLNSPFSLVMISLNNTFYFA